jgi:hypothetical protein
MTNREKFHVNESYKGVNVRALIYHGFWFDQVF